MQSQNPPLPPHLLGFRLLQDRQLPEAEVFFRRIVAINPRAAWGFSGLGQALRGLDRAVEAVSAFREATRLEPSSRYHWLSLLDGLMDLSAWPEAVEAARGLLSLDPDSPASLVCLARALIFDRSAGEAEGCLERAIALGADDATMQYQIGFCFQAMARMDDAESHFRRSIEVDPRLGSGLCALAYIRKATESDWPMVNHMRSLTGDSGLSQRQSILIHYALGKCLQDLGDFEGAMASFDEANRLERREKFGSASFDRMSHRRWSRFLAQTFDREFVERHRFPASGEVLPIFVIGMIRSGTTLVEQILCSHPEVGGAGELRFWMDHGRTLLDAGRSSVDIAELPRLAGEYVALLQRLTPGKRCVVDKMPDNYALAPLIHMALPNAKFIHIARNPADTCLSIYTTPNEAKIAWMHDKESIVFTYRDYRRLLSRWRQVLPAEALLEIRYEELVFDQERVTRQMIEFCGLEWDDACLHPEATRSTVVTPSQWQVRQPVYTASVDRWRRYEPWLGAFAELLEEGSGGGFANL